MNGKGRKEKIPIYFRKTQPIFFAGIFEGSILFNYRRNKENISEIHNRQPVIIKQTDINRYLNLDLKGSVFLKECNKPDLIFHEVSKDVNKPTNNNVYLTQSV